MILPDAPGRDVRLAGRVAAAATLVNLLRALRHAAGRQDGWYEFAFRVCVWGPISSTLPASIALAAMGAGRWLRMRRGRHLGDWLWSALRGGLRLWVLLELANYALFRTRLRSLGRRRHLPPRKGQVPGRRLATLQKHLGALDLAAGEEEPHGKVNTLVATRRLGSQSMVELACGVHAHGFIRHESDKAGHAWWLTQTVIPKGSSGNLRSAPSAESLLRLWDDKDDQAVPFPTEARSHHDTRLLQLRRADISGWFCGADMEDLSRENLKDWLAEYFFYGSAPQEVEPEEVQELEEMVSTLAEWVGRPDMPAGRNPAVRCKLLSRDPISAVHWPLWWYGFTSGIIPAITDIALRQWGFEKFTSGIIQYWHCRPRSAGSTPRRVGLPAVFCHGLGIGVLPYLHFVTELAAAEVREVFLLDLPHISLRQESDVPSSRETVACVVDMLAAWGHTQAHLIGHSFGTIVVSWMLQNSQVVASASLLDPVCFLLVKHDIITNALYREHDDPLQVALTYFVFRELHVAHTLTRNFFWQQNDLAPSDLQRPALVLLSGCDAIVPAHSVRRLLEAEQARRSALQERPRTSPRRNGLGSTSALELRGLEGAREAEMRLAAAPMEVMWYPRLVHCQFVAMSDIRREVLEKIRGLFRQAESPA